MSRSALKCLPLCLALLPACGDTDLVFIESVTPFTEAIERDGSVEFLFDGDVDAYPDGACGVGVVEFERTHNVAVKIRNDRPGDLNDPVFGRVVIFDIAIEYIAIAGPALPPLSKGTRLTINATATAPTAEVAGTSGASRYLIEPLVYAQHKEIYRNGSARGDPPGLYLANIALSGNNGLELEASTTFSLGDFDSCPHSGT